MIISSIESLLGSVWFAGAAFMVGYIAAHIFNINFLINLGKKAK
jgi:hypothetical protein